MKRLCRINQESSRVFVAGVAFGLLLAAVVKSGLGGTGLAQSNPADQARVQDNPELAQLVQEDQSDRAAQAPDLKGAVGQRDRQRTARVMELYRLDRLRTGSDYFRAALILQHFRTGTAGDADYRLLAHEFCVAAVSRGEVQGGMSLAAASEDRFLTDIGRPQRFGSQYRRPYQVYHGEARVRDCLSRTFFRPTLAEERATAEKLIGKP